MSDIDAVILGDTQGRRGGGEGAGATFVEGRIQSVGPNGAMFTIPSWDNGHHVFGPAPHVHSSTTPPPNALCLVIFMGTGIDHPWILGWWS